MPAITGVVGSGFGPQDAVLRTAMGALAHHEMDGSRADSLGPAQFGVQFHHTLPEDDFDRQPYLAGGERYLVLADARIDNREELAETLGIPTPQLCELSDTELLARGWERYELGLIDRLLGDFAIAVWDNVDSELTLARGPLSSRPIFFSRSASTVAFASLPSGLAAIPAIASSPDLEEVARFLGGGLFQAVGSSFFRHIKQVSQGQAIVLKNGSIRATELWSPGTTSVDIRVNQAGELIRHELDRAVRAQARRRSGPLACMLSSGRDSNAVTAAAARHEPSQVFALTAAPRSPVEGLPPPWIADESDIAARTAALLGIPQETCRSETVDLAAMLDETSAAHFQPFNNPVNLPWIRQIYRSASRGGAGVMLSGATGNFTVSLGGPSFLSDHWRESGLARWWRLARDMPRASGLSFQQIAVHAFGSLVPAHTYAWLRRAAGRERFRVDLPLLRTPFRSQVEAHRKERIEDLRPERSRRAHMSRLVRGIEPGDKYSLACWGVDVRDPTADRRLAETCLSLPVESLIGPTSARPAFEHAFRERLLPEVIDGRHVGAQAADWYACLRPQDVLEGYRRYAGNPIVDELFDLAEVELKIERWPKSAAEADVHYDEYCNQLLGGLAVASFINAHFPA